MGVQLVCVRSRPVVRSCVHKLINQLAAGITQRNGFNDNDGSSTIPLCYHYILFSNTLFLETSAERRLHPRFATYSLNVVIPINQFDITFEPAKSYVAFKQWALVESCIRRAMASFCNTHLGFPLADTFTDVSAKSNLLSITAVSLGRSDGTQASVTPCSRASTAPSSPQQHSPHFKKLESSSLAFAASPPNTASHLVDDWVIKGAVINNSSLDFQYHAVSLGGPVASRAVKRQFPADDIQLGLSTISSEPRRLAAFVSPR